MAHKYFMLHAKGDSVDQPDIDVGDIVLVRQQATAKHGDKVVALIDNKVTIKDYSSIEHTRDFKVQGIVVTTIKEG